MSFVGGSTDLGSAHGKVVLGSDLSGIKAAIVALNQFVAQANTASTQVSASLKNIGQAATDLGQKLSVGLTLPIVAAAGVSLKAASDFNESMSAVQTVFGDAADSVVAFSTDSVAAMILTQNEILQTSATLGNLAKGLGLTEEEAGKFSGEILNAAADLSSFFNVSASDALSSLRSGLAGEIEPLRRFGINMSEAEVQLEAVRIGLIATGQEMTESQKVIARQSFILSHMGDATNDLVRTQGSFSNQLKQLQTDAGNLAAELGQELIPAALKIIEVARGLIGQFRDLPPEVKTAVVAAAALAAALGPLLIILGQVAVAIAAVSVAISAGAIAALTGLAIAAAPVVAILAGVAGVAILAHNITESGAAASDAVPSVNALTSALLEMAAASNDAVEAHALASIAEQWDIAAKAARSAEKDFVSASREEILGGDPSGMATDTLDRARALEEQKAATDDLRLSDEQLADAETDLDTITRNTHANRTDLIIQARHVLDDYVLGVENGGISAAEMARQLDNLARSASRGSSSLGVGAEAASALGDAFDTATSKFSEANMALATQADESLKAADGLGEVVLRAINNHQEDLASAVDDANRALSAQADVALRDAEALGKVVVEAIKANQAASDLKAIQAGLASGAGFGADSGPGVEQRAERDQKALDETGQKYDDLARDQKTLADATEQADQRRADAEKQYASQVKSSERDAAQAAHDAAASAEKATRDANVQRAQSARAYAKTIADLNQQEVEAGQQAQEDLTNLAEERAQKETEYAQQRADIEANLQQQLADAEQQFNQTQQDNLEQQSELRSQLAESLKEAADQWHDANQQAKEDLKSIREELIQTLKETREEFERFTRDSATSEQRLREDLARNLEDIGIARNRINQDLAAKLVDPNLSPEQRAQARIDAQRQLEDLARREQDVQVQFGRDLEGLEQQRHDEELQHEQEEKDARDAAHAARLQQKQELKDAEKAYHDKRLELEGDAAEKIGQLQSDLGDAASAFHDQQSKLRDDALTQINDLATEEANAQADLAEKEQLIYDDRAKAFADLEAQKTLAFRTAEQDRTLIAREEQNARDLAARGQDSAERTAARDQRKALRQVQSEEDDIDKDLAKQRGETTGTEYGSGFIGGIEGTFDAAETAGEQLANAVDQGLRNAAQMHSPSRVMWQRGQTLAESLIGGIASRNAGVAAAFGDLMAMNTGAKSYAASAAAALSQQRSAMVGSGGSSMLSATVVIEDKQLRQYVLGTAIAPMIGSRDRVASGGMW